MLQNNTVVYLGDVLNYLFDHMTLNVYQKDIGIDLMFLFPLLKARHAFKSTIDNVIETYLDIHDLNLYNLIAPDNLLNVAFNGNIAAEFYIHKDIGILYKIHMKIAISQGLISNYVNSYQAVDAFSTITYGNFIPPDTLKMLKCINYHELNNQDDYNLIYKDLIKESKLSFRIHMIINDILVYKAKNDLDTSIITLEEFLGRVLCEEEDVEIEEDMILLNGLLSDPWIKLIYSIIDENRDLVRQTLNYIDPRIHNNEAYLFALQGERFEMAQIIETEIARRNWIENQALKQSFERLLGPSDISKTLFPHGTQL